MVNSDTHQENGNETSNPRELTELADLLLKTNGYHIWGGKISGDDFQQGRFESRMQKGAYCGSRRK